MTVCLLSYLTLNSVDVQGMVWKGVHSFNSLPILFGYEVFFAKLSLGSTEICSCKSSELLNLYRLPKNVYAKKYFVNYYRYNTPSRFSSLLGDSTEYFC